MITFENVCKSYDGVDVLNNLNLKIADNEAFGIIGPSGVGKSTILNCLNGLEKYQRGSVVVDGVRVETLSDAELRRFRKNVGLIFQNFSLIGRKDVFHNISFPMECWGCSKTEIKDRVEELAEVTGMQEKLKSRPAELSGGQKQRVAIARALALNPRYLLCDECTSALDPRSTASVLELLESLRKKYKITIIIVTHEMAVVRRFCERVGIIDGGKASLVGNVAEIFREVPKQLRTVLGDEEGKVSFTIDIDDFESCRKFLDDRGIRYGIAEEY